MNPDLQRFTLAFLAARCPAAYTSAALTARLNDSGMIDVRITEDETCTVLRTLLRNGYVQSDVEPAGTRLYWNATTAGVAAWDTAGRVYVGR